MRLLLLLFVYLRFSNGHPPCNFEMPVGDYCDQEIDWKTTSATEALALCLDNFPTTFVTARFDAANKKTYCTVRAAYMCLQPNAINIYDKCFEFPKENGKYVTKTMEEYLKQGSDNDLCPGGGKLRTVFYTSKHLRFFAAKAKKLGIERLFVSLKRDTTEIGRPNQKIIKSWWNLEESDYWDGDDLKKGPAPPAAEYVFLRTRTDFVRNRMQGAFELATKKAKAAFACEYKAYFKGDLQWYCDKMAKLGMDVTFHDKSRRCLFLTTLKYTWDGKTDGSNIKDVEGCNETPDAMVHFSSMDDGTLEASAYDPFKSKGRLRVAGVRFELGETARSDAALDDTGKKIMNSVRWKSITASGTQTSVFRTPLDFAEIPKSKPDDPVKYYPAAEPTSFNGDPTTLGMKWNVGKCGFVDLPKEVRYRAICSLKFYQQCEIGKPCGRKECDNKQQYQSADPNFSGFYTCKCPEYHDEKIDHCTWSRIGHYTECAAMKFIGKPTRITDVQPTFKDVTIGGPNNENDLMYEVVVRERCRFWANSHSVGDSQANNVNIVDGEGFGVHVVPNGAKGTLMGAYHGLSASSYKCTCP